MLETADGLDLSTDVELAGSLVQVGNSRVLLVTAKDLLGLELPVKEDVISGWSGGIAWRVGAQRKNSLVGPVDVVDGQDGQVAVVTEIAQGDALAALEAELINGLLRQVEGDGHGEESAIGETVLLYDAVISLLASRITNCTPDLSIAYPL